MTRAEYAAAVAEVEAMRAKVSASMSYRERVGTWRIEAVVTGLPLNPPSISVTDDGKHPASISDIPADVLLRAANVKSALAAWWDHGAQWPTPPGGAQ